MTECDTISNITRSSLLVTLLTENKQNKQIKHRGYFFITIPAKNNIRSYLSELFSNREGKK
jgi:hypothetical protein